MANAELDISLKHAVSQAATERCRRANADADGGRGEGPTMLLELIQLLDRKRTLDSITTYARPVLNDAKNNGQGGTGGRGVDHRSGEFEGSSNEAEGLDNGEAGGGEADGGKACDDDVEAAKPGRRWTAGEDERLRRFSKANESLGSGFFPWSEHVELSLLFPGRAD